MHEHLSDLWLPHRCALHWCTLSVLVQFHGCVRLTMVPSFRLMGCPRKPGSPPNAQRMIRSEYSDSEIDGGGRWGLVVPFSHMHSY